MENINEPLFDLPKDNSSVIKVVGVGGGGSNAVNFMYSKGIQGVDFVVCNTDSQALENSPVANKIHLGIKTTEGLGAGGKPETGENAAIESKEHIQKTLESGTKMVFITAGMGGGTGTGAAPIIAGIAKNLGILTVGIVTSPFDFEGNTRKCQAIEGIKKMKEQVDALIVINNNKLIEIYKDLNYKSGFAKADEVLLKAAKGIAEVISYHYQQNIDLNDAKTVLSNSGSAIMGSATMSGDERAQKVIEKALESPLLDNTSISGAKNVLLLIVSGNEEVTMEEIARITGYVQGEAGQNVNIIMGIGEDESLENAISVTVIATGFDAAVEKSTEKHIQNTGSEPSIASGNRVFHRLKDKSESKNSSSEINNMPSDNETSNSKVEEIIISEETEETTLLEPNKLGTNDENFTIIESSQEDKKEAKENTNQYEIMFDFPIANHSEENKQERKNPSQETFNLKDNDEDNTRHYNSEDSLGENCEDIKLIIKDKPIKSSVSQEEDPLSANKTENHCSEKGQQHIKKINFKYQSLANIDKIEEEPAYKRLGIDISQNEKEPNIKSNSSISLDNNDKVQIRTNNSFLHDNVD